MKLLDLFSGIGGFSLAARWAGIETVGFCEIDPYCRRVLEKNFSGVPIHGDIRTLRGDEFGPIDIITGGDPCQPHSNAGKRKGKADDRYLWPEMLRVIQRCKPNWIVNENVVGSVSNLVLDTKISDLEAIGYACRPFIIPACGVEAPHLRERVWLIANASGLGRKEGGDRAVYRAENEKNAGAKFTGLLESTGKWKVNPGIRLLDDGVPGRLDRLKALGNAIVPQIAYQIFKAIFLASNSIQKQEVGT